MTDNINDFIDVSEEMVINSIFTNANKSLISVIQDNKINFFDATNYKEYADGLGDDLNRISICVPLNQSQLCLIVGKQGNDIFPYNRVVIWDLAKKSQIGAIDLNFEENSDDCVVKIYVNNKALFIVLKRKILLFNIMNLEYITTFEDVKGDEASVSFSCTKEENLSPHITFAYISNLNDRVIKIVKVYYSTKQKKIFCAQHTLVTDFIGVQFISVSTKCKFLAVVSSEGDKINIYSLKSYKARTYLWRGYSTVRIINIAFDLDDKFLCLLSTQKTFHIYPLLRRYLRPMPKENDGNEGNEVISIRSNNSEDDDQDYYNYGRRKPGKVKGFFKSIRKKIGKKYKESYAKYKDDKVLIHPIVFFYFNPKLDLIVYDRIGRVLVIKFNKRKGGMCWLHQQKYLQVSEF